MQENNKIIDEINEISDGLFDNITNLDQYALSTSKQVLKILIQYACLGQNCGPIELGRKKIGEIINREWLIQHFMEVADESINYFELKEKVLTRGINSVNEEIREVVEDFRDK